MIAPAPGCHQNGEPAGMRSAVFEIRAQNGAWFFRVDIMDDVEEIMARVKQKSE